MPLPAVPEPPVAEAEQQTAILCLNRRDVNERAAANYFALVPWFWTQGGALTGIPVQSDPGGQNFGNLGR